MCKLLSVSLIAILVLSGSALSASSTPSTHTSNVMISGTAVAAGSSDVNPGTGACDFSSWVDQCSATNCNCSALTSEKISGTGLKGPEVTDFFVTADNDINPASEATVDSGPDPKCNPFRGVVVVTLKDGTSTTANFLGVSCKHVVAFSKKHPSGNYDTNTLSGGWGIDASTDPASGWGTFTGTVNHQSNALSLKLMGWVTQ